MKYIFKTLVLAATLLLSACFIKIEPVQPNLVNTSNYEIGKSETANSGSEMISIKTIFTLPKYKANYTYQPPVARFTEMPLITPVQRWVALFTHDDLYILASPDYGKNIGIEITKDGKIINSKPFVQLEPEMNLLRQRTGRLYQSPWNLPNPQLFSPLETYPLEKSYKIDLIYGGKLDNVIEIIAKEYINDFSKASKYLNIKHDLRSSDIFNYKTMKIQVIEATESTITFKVLEDGGLPWVFEQK